MIVAFIDTETTGTNPALHEPWQVGVVIDEDGVVQHEAEFSWYPPFCFENAEPKALEVGGFWDTVKQHQASGVAQELSHMLHDIQIASCNISFDTGFLRAFLHRAQQPVTWHYSPIDVKSMAYGRRPDLLGAKTDVLVEAFGISVEGRHTALGDAKLARDLYHAIRNYV